MIPLLKLDKAIREFPAGDSTVAVLKSISLSIDAGEMIAIVGASGSGKSTLMNILGCLDHLSAGTYAVNGKAVGALDKDALARLRREHFGFIFQRYHLLPTLSAVGNVEMPAIYAGAEQSVRHARALHLLDKLGLAERTSYLPGQLSGGQQQRVSIARALMNGGDVILADEPTGALDSKSGEEVLNILHELHALGHTIIIVTHDASVAANAQRIIEIKDGQIIRDAPNPHYQAPLPKVASESVRLTGQESKPGQAKWGSFKETFKMAWRALLSHRLRTALTMLGIIIGIMSVVSIAAIGEGAKNYILNDIRAIGTNTLDIFPGTDWGDDKAKSIRTLLPQDIAALQAEPYVDSVTPWTFSAIRLRYKNIDVDASVRGVGEQFLQANGSELESGVAFTKRDIQQQAQVAIINQNVKRKFFGSHTSPLGEIILLGSIPVRVIGVTANKKNMFNNTAQNLNIAIPYSTAASRILGRVHFDQITVRIADGQPSQLAEGNIIRLLTLRHGGKDFFTYNMDSIVKTAENTTQSLSLLLSLIALISLIVGGIGVMNIMLVSVTERTREIGIRMAVGARQRDVMQQFLTEAVLVCLIGGVIGILLSYGVSLVFGLFISQWKMVFSVWAVATAFLCALVIGIVFGYLPARNAARLDPIDALARE
jgi:macrolide transport system ATP-binding/permease protein